MAADNLLDLEDFSRESLIEEFLFDDLFPKDDSSLTKIRKKKRSPNKERGHEEGTLKILSDYFNDGCTYNQDDFRRYSDF